MAEEEIIKRRLVVDGDGTGDDRRLTALLKLFARFCNTETESPADREANKDRMLLNIQQCEYSFAKSRLMSDISEVELKNYEKLTKEIIEGIESAKKQIQETKEELKKARIIRKNRSEYEAIANVIQQHQPRTETSAKLAQTQKELSSLEEIKNQLDKKFEVRRKHFHVLVASLCQLESMLNEDDDVALEESHVDISDDDIETTLQTESPDMMEE